MHLERVVEDDDIMGIDEEMAAKIAVEKEETTKIHVKKKFLKKEADENHQALKEREDLEQKFNDIYVETGTNNIDQLIELFQEMEEKN
jgi:di/tripeptidase